VTRQILIIDDEEDIREVAQLTLEALGGWQVQTAASGREGVAQAIAQQPDAILLDVMMPELDGLATFQQLQSHPTTRPIPVILLTAKVQAADRRRFEQLGVTAVIAKPFNPLSLAEQVAAALNWKV
jgi:two-component system, OmpR family, alkaline phosphatase synthesis response regulator PhoP